jgi:predicted ATPase
MDLIQHTLPTAQTSFVGGESAIATVKALLHGTQLLTLTGSGGSGKTRLALRVAEESLSDYPNGVWWVDLSALAEPGLVAQAVAGALGLKEQPHSSFIELLNDHLCEQRTLLVLDNCEQLRAACAQLLTPLLRTAAGVRVLATSRAPLAVEGEKLWPVPLLSIPGARPALPAGELLRFEAVELFCDRVRTVAPFFRLNAQNSEAVAEICRLLEGMPLAEQCQRDR